MMSPVERKDPAAEPGPTAEAAVAVASTPAPRRCPYCHGKLTHHPVVGGAKDGCHHCDDCGSCWLPDLSAQREGHPAPTEVKKAL